MLIRILGLVGLLLLIGCEPTPIADNEIHYIKDTRTNICFASVHEYGIHEYSLATVPCDKVKNFVKDIAKDSE